MKINTILVLVLGGICYLVLPFLILLIKNEKTRKIVASICLVGFVGVLLIGVWSVVDANKDYVNITFNFGGKWCNKTMKWDFSNISTFDLVINLVMLFPIGIFSFYFFKNKKILTKFLLLTLIGAFCGSFIELSQYILPISRSVQLSDIVFNTISVLFGGIICWFYQWIISLFRKKKNVQ